MSRVGQSPVAIPSGVDIKIDGQKVTAKGKNGELSVTLGEEVTVAIDDGTLTVMPQKKDRRHRRMWGLSRNLVNNIVVGVSDGFTKTLELHGVGYRAQMKGKDLVLALGLSHDVVFEVPDGLEIKVPNQTTIEVSGADKRHVGETAAKIRSFRPPEPYKGKGIRYAGEYILRKEGKKK